MLVTTWQLREGVLVAGCLRDMRCRCCGWPGIFICSLLARLDVVKHTQTDSSKLGKQVSGYVSGVYLWFKFNIQWWDTHTNMQGRYNAWDICTGTSNTQYTVLLRNPRLGYVTIMRELRLLAKYLQVRVTIWELDQNDVSSSGAGRDLL